MIEVGESLPTVAHGRASSVQVVRVVASILRTIEVAIRKDRRRRGMGDGGRTTALLHSSRFSVARPPPPVAGSRLPRSDRNSKINFPVACGCLCPNQIGRAHV